MGGQYFHRISSGYRKLKFKLDSDHRTKKIAFALLCMSIVVLGIFLYFLASNHPSIYAKRQVALHHKLYSYFYGGTDDSFDDIEGDALHHKLLGYMEDNPCAGHAEPFIIAVRVTFSGTAQAKFMADLEHQMKNSYSRIGCLRAFVFNVDPSPQSVTFFADQLAKENSMKTVYYIEDMESIWDLNELDRDVVAAQQKTQRRRSRDIIYILRRLSLVTETHHLLYIENDGKTGLCGDALARTSKTMKFAEGVNAWWQSILLAPRYAAFLVNNADASALSEYMESHIHSGGPEELMKEWRSKNGARNFVSSGSIGNKKCNDPMRKGEGVKEKDAFDYTECDGKWAYPCKRGQRTYGWFEDLKKWAQSLGENSQVNDIYYSNK